MAQTDPNNTIVVAEKVDEEVMRLADQNVFASSWASPLKATPVAITLLGECMITACMENAYLINVNGPSIPNLSLPTCLRNCSNLGLEAFKEAQIRMHKIGIKSISIAGARRTIDKIVTIVDGKDSSPKARKFLDQQLKDVQAAADLCRTESEAIGTYIQGWAKYTDEIREATDKEQGKIRRDAQDVEAKAKITQEAKDNADKAKADADSELKEAADFYKATMQARLKATENWEAHAARGVVLTMLSFGLGASYFVGTIVNSMYAEANVQGADARQKRQAMAQEEAIIKQEELLHELKLLRQQKGALDQFNAIVGRVVRDLQRVQKSIAQLLTFFAEVSNNVQVLVADCNKTMVGELEGSMDDFLFPEFTRDSIRDHAMTLKASFLCIGAVCGAYKDVSERYILPGLQTIDQLALSSGSISAEHVEQRSLQLQKEYTEPAVKGVDELTQQKERELETNVHKLLTNSTTAKMLGPAEGS